MGLDKLFGAGKKTQARPQIPAKPEAAPPTDAPVETQVEKDAKTRIALNAGLTQEQQSSLAKPATVTKRALLGL